jgi:hypothetical protein
MKVPNDETQIDETQVDETQIDENTCEPAAFNSRERMPCNWDFKFENDEVFATCIATGRIFRGDAERYNKLLRGEKC